MIFIGDLEPYRKEIAGKRKKQYQRLLEQADRYKTMVLPEEHPKESTTYMGIAIPNLALAYCLSGDEEYLHQAKRFIRTVLSYEKWGNAHLVNVDLSASWILFGLSLGTTGSSPGSPLRSSRKFRPNPASRTDHAGLPARDPRQGLVHQLLPEP